MADTISKLLLNGSQANSRLSELTGVTILSVVLCYSLLTITSRETKGTDEVGPIMYQDVIITEPDITLWEGVKTACIEAVSEEPILDRMLQHEVLRHPNLESSLSQILSHKLGSDSLSASELKIVFDEVLLKKCRGVHVEEYPDAFDWPPKEGKYDLATLIRSDLWAVKER